MLFGDVTGVVSRGSLFLTGDFDDNWIDIDQAGLAADDQFSPQSSEVFGNVRFAQGTGSGSALIGNDAPAGVTTIHGRCIYVGGDGVEHVRFNRAVIFDRTRISTGADDDLIEVFNSLFVGPAILNGGSGTDTLDDDPTAFFLGGRSLVSIEAII